MSPLNFSNGSYQAAYGTATATDMCDTSPTCKIVSVTSNEPVLGSGSGQTSPDWVLTDPGPKVSPASLGVQLRAERAGGGNGRVYTVNVSCSDASGVSGGLLPSFRTEAGSLLRSLGPAD